MFGKISITGAFVFIYLYGIELLPTVVRNMGLGVTTMASRIGSCFSPYIAYMGGYLPSVPTLVYSLFVRLFEQNA